MHTLKITPSYLAFYFTTVFILLVFLCRQPGLNIFIVFAFLSFALSFATHWKTLLYNQCIYEGNIVPMRVYHESVSAWVKYIKTEDPHRAAYLWYNPSDNWPLRGYSAASHLWQERLLNESMPALNAPVATAKTADIKDVKNLIIITPSKAQRSPPQLCMRLKPQATAQTAKRPVTYLRKTAL